MLTEDDQSRLSASARTNKNVTSLWPTPRLMVTAIILTFVTFIALEQNGYDFRAFYCAGAVARMGQNPYYAQPLQACERLRTDKVFAAESARTAVPAPIPGYDIAFFESLSVFPYRIAAAVWTALLLAALAVTALCLVKLSGQRDDVVVAALCLSAALPSLTNGELVPIVLASISATALLLRQRRFRLAGCCALFSLCEPHLGLPLCAALFIWVPNARLSIAGGIAVAATLSAVAIGPRANYDYLFRVLPVHAISEAGADTQLSLLAVLFGLGLNALLALKISALQFAASVAAGVIVAQRLSRVYQNQAYLALTPPAFAVLGGSFLHITQVAVAIPLCLVLASSKTKYHWLVIIATLLIALPLAWIYSAQLAVFGILVIMWLVWGLTERLGFSLACSSAIAVVTLLLVLWQAPPRYDTPRALAIIESIPTNYAEASWAREQFAYVSSGSIDAWARRIPTWGALVVLVYCAALTASAKSISATFHYAPRNLSIKEQGDARPV